MNTLDAIRGRAAFALSGHRDEALRGAEWDRAALLAAVEGVLALHKPVDAAMYGSRNIYKVQVCTGCGQDDGNWQRYPCPTVRAITGPLGADL